jgi:hypothetical protein
MLSKYQVLKSESYLIFWLNTLYQSQKFEPIFNFTVAKGMAMATPNFIFFILFLFDLGAFLEFVKIHGKNFGNLRQEKIHVSDT